MKDCVVAKSARNFDESTENMGIAELQQGMESAQQFSIDRWPVLAFCSGRVQKFHKFLVGALSSKSPSNMGT